MDWSADMTLRMFKDVEGGLSVPQPTAAFFERKLREWGYEIVDVVVAIPGTSRLHAQIELRLAKGADPALGDRIDRALKEQGVTAQRSNMFNDAEMVDITWNLPDISVWKQ